MGFADVHEALHLLWCLDGSVVNIYYSKGFDSMIHKALGYHP